MRAREWWMDRDDPADATPAGPTETERARWAAMDAWWQPAVGQPLSDGCRCADGQWVVDAYGNLVIEVPYTPDADPVAAAQAALDTHWARMDRLIAEGDRHG